MTTIDELSTTLQTLFTTTADKVGRESGFIRRQRKISGSGFAQAIVLGGIITPEATRKQQHEHANAVGIEVSVQGMEQRFTASACDFMRKLLEAGLEQVVSSETKRVMLPQFNGVYITDCSRLDWQQEGSKIAVRWEIQSGQLRASLSEINRHDQKTGQIEQPMPRGALHLGDLGFFKLKRFADWSQQGIYWLSRYKVGTHLARADGTALDLLHLLTKMTAPLCVPVRVGKRQSLCAYLIAAPLPPEALVKREAHMREQARLDQRPLSCRQSSLMGYTLYLTNIPDLSFEQAHTLARTRWQIECLFKLWKSQARLLTSRSANPTRQLCEGYAKLLGILVSHWILLVTGWLPVRLSLLDALRLVRTHMPNLMRAFRKPHLWRIFFDALVEEMPRLSSRSYRRQAPSAFQLWQAFLC